MRRGRRSGLFTMVAVHSTARGPSLGGCRMWTYDDSRAAVRDVLRLSRAMTFKAACADLPQGGGKGVIVLRPGERLDAEGRRDVLLDFAETVDALGGRYRTAEDVGTSDADMAVIAQGTAHVTGLASGSGDPSPWTALGVEAAILTACERVWGTASLAGRRIAVVGLGRVGGHLARILAAAGAELTVSDLDPSRRALAEELGARWIEPDTAMESECDVLAPCALGAVLDERSIPALRCRVIAGAANNQLSAEAGAERLASRDVLWIPDFVANAGGIINIGIELEPGGYAVERAEPAVRRIGDTVQTLLDEADSTGSTPLAAAMGLARRRLADAAPAGR